MCTDVPAPNPGITPPGASNQRRRSGKASPDSGASKSLQETDIPKKAGRKSSSLTSKRASISRSQHDILQMICSRRRSGASEANLIGQYCLDRWILRAVFLALLSVFERFPIFPFGSCKILGRCSETWCEANTNKSCKTGASKAGE